MWLMLAIGAALAGSCDLDTPADAPFAALVAPEAERVRLLIEVWLDADNIGWAKEVVSELNGRGVPALLAVALPVEAPDPELVAFLLAATEAGNEVVIVFQATDVPRDALANNKPYRLRLKPIRQAGVPLKVAASPIPGKVSEALLGRLGFKTIILLRGPASSLPRPAAVFEGQPRVNVVLHGGPYSGDCGNKPDVGPFTPAAADRITQAVAGAARSVGVPTVRVAIQGSAATDTDAAVLGRWLDEVVLPAKMQVTTANSARLAALQSFRSGKADPVGEDAGGGRMVSVEELRTAAASLDDQNILPRTLPGDLNITEAFYGFLVVLAGKEEGTVVRLGALAGPTDAIDNQVEGIVEVDGEALKTLAAALLDELPSEVPSAMSVGGTFLGASELFTAMASAVRGEDPPRTWPTASPDPNARGLGWGEATLP